MSETQTEEFTPKIITFACWKWGYAAADMAGTIRAEYPSSLRIIRVICTARVASDHIIRALAEGADMVLIVGCYIGECDFKTGNTYQFNQVKYLKEVVEAMGLERERVNMEFCSAAEGARFSDFAKKYDKLARELGPNPLKLIDPNLRGKPAKSPAKK